MFRFENSQYIWLSALAGLVIVLFLLAEFIRRKRIKRAGNSSLIRMLIPETSLTRRIWKVVLICIAIISMSFSLARPQFGSKLEDVTRQGVEIIVALDVSNSMLAEDVKPNRLENARKFIERIVSNLENDKTCGICRRCICSNANY